MEANKPRTKGWWVKRISTVVFLLTCGLIAALVINYTNTLKNVEQGLSNNQVNAIGTPTATATAHPTGTPAPILNHENILLLGSDDQSSDNDDGARSDTMIIIGINAARDTVTGVSIPRDLMVEDAPSCYMWDSKTRTMTEEVWYPRQMTQANSAFSMGGPACAVRLAEHISGLHITRYIEVDFAGFKALVDAVGGVQVNICAPMIDTNSGVGTIFEEPGIYTIDGEKALQFVRARHVIGDTGSDTSRMGRQQYLLERIIDQKINSSLLLNPSRVNDLAQVFVDNTRTDNVDSDFLIDSALATRGIKDLSMFTLPTREWEVNNNRLVDYPERTAWIFEQIRNGRQVDLEKVDEYFSPTPTPTPTQPSSSPAPIQDDSPTTVTPDIPTPTATSSIPCGWGG